MKMGAYSMTQTLEAYELWLVIVCNAANAMDMSCI